MRPQQLWIDGIASRPGKICRSVATPMGSGYSIENQLTGQDLVGGIQFEITPKVKITAKIYKSPGSRIKESTRDIQVFVEGYAHYAGLVNKFKVPETLRVDEFGLLLQQEEGIYCHGQRRICGVNSW